jgi:hypothetical protein
MDSQLTVMHNDERAWLRVKALEPSEVPGNEVTKRQVLAGQEMIWTLNLANVGKTAARNVALTAYVEVADAVQGVHLGCVDGTLTCTNLNKTTGILFPGVEFEKFAVNRRDQRGQPWLVSDAEASSFIEGKSFTAVYGIVTYDDIFDSHHWTKFCFWDAGKVGAGFHARPCTQYSNTDNTR